MSILLLLYWRATKNCGAAQRWKLYIDTCACLVACLPFYFLRNSMIKDVKCNNVRKAYCGSPVWPVGFLWLSTYVFPFPILLLLLPRGLRQAESVYLHLK